MDIETLKSLGWLLLLGGAFYVMMRYGCGAHMMGGHGHGDHHGHGGAGDAGGGGKDPVCGMVVDPQNAAAAAVYGGRTHYFCSASCREKFEEAPEKYAGAAAQQGRREGGCHHG